MSKAARELEHCAESLSRETGERRLTILINISPDQTGDLFGCWAFAKRMMELASQHSIITQAKVYSSTPNATLIALATDRFEVKRGAPCRVSYGKVHIGRMLNGRPDWLDEATSERFCTLVREIAALVDRKAYRYIPYVVYGIGESLCLGTTGFPTNGVVGAYFGEGEKKNEGKEQGIPAIPVLLFNRDLKPAKLAAIRSELLHLRTLASASPDTNKICLVFDSPGGVAEICATFRDELLAAVEADGVEISAKIYRAGSAAAALALVASRREIVSDAELVFHTSCIDLPLAKIFPCTRDRRAAGLENSVEMQAFEDILRIQMTELEWIRSRAPGLPSEKLDTLERTTILRLTPEQARGYGIVHDVIARDADSTKRCAPPSSIEA